MMREIDDDDWRGSFEGDGQGRPAASANGGGGEEGMSCGGGRGPGKEKRGRGYAQDSCTAGAWAGGREDEEEAGGERDLGVTATPPDRRGDRACLWPTATPPVSLLLPTLSSASSSSFLNPPQLYRVAALLSILGPPRPCPDRHFASSTRTPLPCQGPGSCILWPSNCPYHQIDR